MSILGIDISKKTLDVALLHDGIKRHKKFSNTVKGFARLQKWLSVLKVAQVHACMEATGIYWEDIAFFLHQQGHQVSVINPLQIKAFRQTELGRNKNDKLDSALIARFCQEKSPKLWVPPSPEMRSLKQLTRHLDSLKLTRSRQKNLLESCRNDAIEQSIKELIAFLDEKIAQTESLIEQLIDQDKQLKEKEELLTSIPGIGKTTANIILSEIADIDNYKNARQAAAYTGLTPRQFQSGTSVNGKPKLSKIGNARIRKALYFPAITALKHNPIIKRLYDRLSKKGKSKMCIIGAIMRKLIHIAYGVLKNNTPFDPNYAK